MRFVKLQLDDRRSVTFIIRGLLRKRVYLYWLDADGKKPMAIEVPFIRPDQLEPSSALGRATPLDIINDVKKLITDVKQLTTKE